MERHETSGASDASGDDSAGAGAEEDRTGRRQLLSKAGLAAAGAVAGSAALAMNASPASAASGSFDGNPAVLGVAANGIGIWGIGESSTSTGVYGQANATTGETKGVWGVNDSVAGRGVYGLATAATGATFGVLGEVNSTGGSGVAGTAEAATGTTYGVKGVAKSVNGIGVEGGAEAETGPTRGVQGYVASPAGRGVSGLADGTAGGGVGVFGYSRGSSGTGVEAVAEHATGPTRALNAYATSTSGTGVVSDGVTSVQALSNRTHLKLGQRNAAWPAPPLGAGLARQAGELVFDGTRWWLCVGSGTPGDWREVAGPSTAGSLHLLDAAVRAYDSRPGLVPTGVKKGKLEQNQERTLDLTVGGGLPAGARAALINLTVTGTSEGGGFLKLFKPGTPVPSASAINWSTSGQNIANSATVAVGPTGGLTVRCGGLGASTDVIVDVAGYYL